MFVLPAGPNSVIGTTDTYTSMTPDNVRATNEDVRYLIDSANAFFPRARLVTDDVVAAWAGIRPLVPATGDTPGAASREHAITTGLDGVVSITGGKLTTFRLMAAEVIDVVMQRLRREHGESPTAITPLPGGDFHSLERLIAAIATETQDVELAEHLAYSFGSRWPGVWSKIAEHGAQRLMDSLPYTIGEARYCVRHEMALTLGDLLIRRMHLAYETRDHGLEAAPRVAEIVAPLLGWDFGAQRRAVEHYSAEVDRIFSVIPNDSTVVPAR
jgi:glycerol-3-phosphate dehydrogenase